ncbi:hypothetical protein BDY21DRAFT_348989 [Lineolata rhizophorae]|uniref:Uncharacterized protein n=1 Tax=Lineolata rhizophorae TaxID=578093 RepID=A0A6A6NVT4_9PEZI|nr:hypothetical protein BDY21DRAFT_348989 [Lineolata rhizophorae]
MGGGTSEMGESSAVLLRYLGVRGSELWGGEMYDGSMPRAGNVWLRGRWKLLPALVLFGWPRLCCCCCC